jgi:DNA-binding response OmpR family regulator
VNRKISLLIVEDDIDYVDIIRICLEEPDSMGLTFELERADRLELGLKLLDAARFDAVLLDLTLPDSRGLETISRVIDRGYDVPILVMTNLGDESVAFEAMRLGAQDYMVKATSDSRLLKRAIWYAIERHKLARQSENLIRKAADGMVVVDGAGAIRFVNEAAERLFGKKRESLLGNQFPHPVAPGAAKQVRLESPSGERTVDLRVTELEWRGEPGLLVLLHDITDLQRLEQLKALKIRDVVQ